MLLLSEFMLGLPVLLAYCSLQVSSNYIVSRRDRCRLRARAFYLPGEGPPELPFILMWRLATFDLVAGPSAWVIERLVNGGPLLTWDGRIV